MRRRKIRTRPRELGAAALAALCLSGCGGEDEQVAPHPPTFPRSLAAALAARTDAVAGALESDGSCRARTLARRLQRDTITAINGGDVPARLQEELAGAVNDLAGRAVCPSSSPQPHVAQRARNLARWLRARSR